SRKATSSCVSAFFPCKMSRNECEVSCAHSANAETSASRPIRPFCNARMPNKRSLSAAARFIASPRPTHPPPPLYALALRFAASTVRDKHVDRKRSGNSEVREGGNGDHAPPDRSVGVRGNRHVNHVGFAGPQTRTGDRDV